MTAPVLRLPAAMAEEIVAHAREAAPRECCGVIAGDEGGLRRVYRTENVAPGNELYEIDPQALFDLEFRELPARGWSLSAIYHSHPHSPAYPSSTDVSLAGWPDAVYVICSLEDAERPVLRAFRIRDGEIDEAAVEIA